MRKGFLGALAALLAGSGIALGQGYYPSYPPPAYYPPPGWQNQQPMVQPTWTPQQIMQMQQWQMQQQMQRQMQTASMPAQPNRSAMSVGMPQQNGQAMMPAQYYQGPVPIYAQPYYPVVRSWGPVGGQQYPGMPVAASPSSRTMNSPNSSSVQTADQRPSAWEPARTPKLPASAIDDSSNSAAESLPVTTPVSRKRNAACPNCQAGEPDPLPESADACPLACPEEPATCPPACEPPHRTPRGYRGYANFEILYWWIRRADGPALFSVTDARGTFNVDPRDLINQERLGGRGTLGYWFNAEQTLALEGSGFSLGNRNTRTALGGTSTISRPFFDLATGTEAAFILPPGSTANLDSLMRLYGAEFSLRWEVCRSCGGHLDLLAGPRFLQFDESLNLVTNDGFTTTSDTFGTHNQFWGAQLGMEAEVNRGRYFLNGSAKIAGGSLSQVVNITGQTLSPLGFAPGGFLTQPTNMGHFSTDRFGFIPEAGLNLGMQVTSHARLFGGYSLLVLPRSVRPGDQIDRNLNFVGGPPVGPVFQWNTTTFWAQGVTGGLEIRY